MYQQALYLHPPAERLKTMMWRVKQHCLFGHVYHLQKNNAQLMVICNDSISKFYQSHSRLLSRYVCFLVSASVKKEKNVEAIKFLQSQFYSKNKKYFCLKKKSNVSLNKKVIFVFRTIFKLDFITQIVTVLSTVVCILFSYFFVLLYQFLRNGTYKQC